MRSGVDPPVPLCETSDADLIAFTLQGHTASFDDLILRHKPPIFLMVMRCLRQREDSEDVVQLVFLKALQHLDRFRGESKFSTWLYTIALNLVRNHVRQKKSRLIESLDRPPPNEDMGEKQWPDKSPSTDDIVMHRWELSRVLTAWDTLPEPHRGIFSLHYFQHLPLKEVGLRLSRPEATVKVYLHRARKMVLFKLDSKIPSRAVTSDRPAHSNYK